MEHFIAVTCLVTFIATLSFCSGASIKSEDPPCRSEVSRIQKEHLENNFFLNYVVLPQCDKRGYYKALQRTIEGFMCSTPYGTPVDYSYFTAQGPCRRLQQCVKHYQSEGANDHNLIRCDKFGYFKRVQRTEAGKICVAVYGKIFKTTNVSRKRDCYDAIFRH